MLTTLTAFTIGSFKNSSYSNDAVNISSLSASLTKTNVNGNLTKGPIKKITLVILLLSAKNIYHTFDIKLLIFGQW